jgi:hypothetical protein
MDPCVECGDHRPVSSNKGAATAATAVATSSSRTDTDTDQDKKEKTIMSTFSEVRRNNIQLSDYRDASYYPPITAIKHVMAQPFGE